MPLSKLEETYKLAWVYVALLRFAHMWASFHWEHLGTAKWGTITGRGWKDEMYLTCADIEIPLRWGLWKHSTHT